MGRKNRKLRSEGGVSGSNALSRAQKRELKENIDKILDLCTKPLSTGSKEWDDFMELHQVVSRVQQLQTGNTTEEGTREETFTEFFDWLKSNGVDTDNVNIRKYEDFGYGLEAKRDFKEMEIVLEIPRKMMMTTESAKLSPLGPFMSDDQILQNMPNVALALHVLCEKYSDNSFWQPYINVLPTSYTTPLYYSIEELQLLKGSPALSDSINQFRNIARQYSYFHRHLQMNPLASKLSIKDNFTYEDYRWAVSTVMTRQNPIPEQQCAKMTLGLIPLWDMCNHQNGQLTTDFNLDTDSGECFCMREFQANEQIFIFYGARSNGEFLVHNGFVYKENAHDSVSIKLGISKNDLLFSMKSELLGKIGMLASRHFHLHMGSEPVDSELLAFLRVFVMDEDTLKSKFEGKESQEILELLGSAVSPLTLEMENKAWSFLETRVNLLLKMYPTTYQDDEEMLKENLTGNNQSAVILRFLEKKMLLNAAEYAKEIKERLPLKQ